MTVDFSKIPDDAVTNRPSDTPMFGATPVWERGAKGRRASRSAPVTAPAEPRPTAASPAPRVTPTVIAPERATFAGPTYAAGAAGGARAHDSLGEPLINRQTTRTPESPRPASAPGKRELKGGVAPVAIAAGLIVIAGLGAAGWYATQTDNAQIAELAPSSTVTVGGPAGAPVESMTLAENTAAPPPEIAMPQAAVATSETPATTTRIAARPAPRPAARRTAAAAPVGAMSAEAAGTNVSATASAASMDTVDYGLDASDAQVGTPAPVNPAPAMAAPAMTADGPAQAPAMQPEPMAPVTP